MKKLLCIALAVVLVVALAACTKPAETTSTDPDASAALTGDLANITSKGKMVIGYTDYAPMNFFAEDGTLTGFDTEFAEAVCEKLGVTPEFVEIDWDNKFIELASESIDCIWNGMTITEEAKLNANVTNPYVKNAQVVVMAADKAANYKSVADMTDLKFAAEAGSAGEGAIKDNKLDGKYVAVPNQTDALLEVVSGSVDACVIDITMANAMTGEGTSYAALTTVLELTTEEYGIAFRKASNVTERVNAIMEELKAEGTLEALAEKYQLTLAF